MRDASPRIGDSSAGVVAVSSLGRRRGGGRRFGCGRRRGGGRSKGRIGPVVSGIATSSQQQHNQGERDQPAEGERLHAWTPPCRPGPSPKPSSCGMGADRVFRPTIASDRPIRGRSYPALGSRTATASSEGAAMGYRSSKCRYALSWDMIVITRDQGDRSGFNW